MFKDEIGKTMEAYIDDMIMKSIKEVYHLNHLQTTLGILQKYRLKLNPNKCTFRIRGGKFLRFMVSQRGIKVNPEKIEAIQNI